MANAAFGRIKSGLRRRIIKAYRRLRGIPGKYDSFNRVHYHFTTERTDAPVIFDVGAHHGESIERFRKLYPNAQLHSFEADADNFKTLQARYGTSAAVSLNNFGVGAASGTKLFHRNLKSDTSSFNKVNPDSAWTKLRSRQQNVTVADFTQKSYEVKIGTLDDYIEQKGIAYVDILKIDTQGYEDEVLRGAQRALRSQRIGIIETEIILSDMYEKALSFMELEQLMLPHGYRLFAVDTGGDMLSSPALALNLIYVCRSLIKSEAA